MTIQELHYDFNLAVDKIGGNDRRAFTSSQVDWFLNKAQSMIINNYVTDVEVDYRRINELSTLHIKFPVQQPLVMTAPTTLTVGSRTLYVYECNLGNTLYAHHYITRVHAINVDSNLCEYKSFGRYMDNDDMDDAIMNSFDLQKDNFLYNIGRSSTTIANREPVSLFIYSLCPFKEHKLYIEYIKKPNRINLGGYMYLDGSTTVATPCELPSILHDKLVDLAASLAYASLNDEGYSIKKDIVAND